MPYPLVLDMCIHHFDLMRFFLGADAERVYARAWVPSWSWYEKEPTLAGVYDFAGGVVGVYSGSWCSMGGETSWNGDWRFECSEGVIEWRADGLYGSRVPDAFEQIPLDECPVGGQDYSLAEFVAAIAEGREPECSGRDNLNSINMVFKTVESIEKARAVDF
jgi:predicted dehydrogenase